MAKKRKPKWVWLRYRKNDPAHNVLVSVQRWIHANGGSALVMGGIQLEWMPGDRRDKFNVAVRIVGRAPPPPIPDAAPGEGPASSN